MKHLNNSLPGMFGLFLILTCLLAIVNPAVAQSEDKSLSETLSSLSEDVAEGYLAPIGSAFGTNLNAGWFHRAPEATKLSFDLEIGVVAMGSMFPDDATSFSKAGNFQFSQTEADQILQNSNITPGNPVYNTLLNELTSNSYSIDVSGATIIGKEDDYMQIVFPGQTIQGTTLGTDTVTIPIAGFKGLADVGFLPLIAPQISIGTVYGTQATFRFLPTVEDADLGEVSYFGFGIQHNPGIWLSNPLPVDVAASFFTQTLKIGDLFKTTSTSFGVNASYTLGAAGFDITPYAGFMFESSNMAVTFDQIVETPTGPINQKIEFDLEGESKTRLTLGLSIRLMLINLNADYNIGAYNSFSAGLTFRI